MSQDNMPPRLTQGPPTKGDDFFDREEVVHEIWDTLERASVLLAAPRRFGKTSVMLQMRDKPQQGFTPLFFDIEYVESPQEFILEIMEVIQGNDRLWRRVGAGIKSYLAKAGERIEEVEVSEIRLKLRASTKVDWKDLGKHLISLITRIEPKLLLILDEFPEMIKLMMDRDRENGSNETKMFLSWFRQVRHTVPDDVKLRFIVGGSICLENLLGQIESLSKINDLEKIKVGPFSEADSVEFIKLILVGEGVEDKIGEEAIKAITEEIGTPIPFFIQIMLSSLLRESRHLGTEMTPEFVHEVYEKYLLGTDYKSYFDHYHLRLREYYSGIGGEKDMIKAAKAILTEMSIQGEVLKEQLYQLYLDETKQAQDDDGFGGLMSLLEDEFYLEYQSESRTYGFYSKLLRDWWFRHFGMLKNERGGS